jgi:F-type H+-transporting ATPase subunit delta
MLATIISQRYAQALLQSAVEEGAESQVSSEATALALALGPDIHVKRFLSLPLSSAEEKLGVLLRSFPQPPHRLFSQFLRTVMENRRERFLPGMLREFLRLMRDKQGIVQAELSTTFKLDERQRKLLEAGLSSRLKRKVELVPLVNGRLIGGATLRLGDTIYDGSLRNSLAKLELLLKKEPVKKASKKVKPAKKKKQRVAATLRVSPQKRK